MRFGIKFWKKELRCPRCGAICQFGSANESKEFDLLSFYHSRSRDEVVVGMHYRRLKEGKVVGMCSQHRVGKKKLATCLKEAGCLE
jgi:hypothetical protein